MARIFIGIAAITHIYSFRLCRATRSILNEANRLGTISEGLQGRPSLGQDLRPHVGEEPLIVEVIRKALPNGWVVCTKRYEATNSSLLRKIARPHC